MADQVIQYTEEMVGAGHPTKSDTLNRALLVEHNTDGTHKQAGRLVQVQHASTAALISGSTQIPNDDTIPQNTEGTEVLTCAITPKNVNNLLLIVANVCQTNAAGAGNVLALFQDSIANALAAIGIASNDNSPVTLIHKMTAGTTSATTFKIRFGPSSAVTAYVNAIVAGTSRGLGGVAATTLTILEYAP